MDKRKGIILAVVLFLLIGLGTFVFADEPNDDPKNTGETNGPSDTNNDGSTTNPDEESEVQDEENSGTDDEGTTATNRRPSNSGSTQVIIGGGTGGETSSTDNPSSDNGSNAGEGEENPGEVTEEPDTTAPVITINGESYQGKGNNIGYVNGDVILSLAEENLEVVVTKDGEELSFEDGMTLSLDGKYVITVTDEAGNITEVEVSIDTTAPKFNVTSGTHSDTAIEIEVTDMSLDYVLVYNQDKDEETKENKSEFILEEEATYKLTAVDKLGNETTVWVAIDKTKPDIKVSGTNAIENKFGGEVTLKVFDKFLTEVSVNGEVFTEKDFISAGNNENRTFTINYENNSKNSGTYIVNAKDKFGHDNTYEFTIDNDAPESNWVYILNADEDNRTIIGNNQKLIVEINVNEELGKNPVITIGDWTEELTRRANDSRYIYSKTITIDAEKMKLVHDEDIKFTIEVTDLVGNTTTLDNDDVTYHEEKGYGQVKYDGEAPKIINLGITGFLEEAVDGADAHYVNDGKGIRILIYVNELLEVDPTVEIGNQTFTATYRQKSSDLKNNIYAYYVDIEDVSKLGLEQGIIEFTVSGYKDKIGNVGETVTQKDTTYSESSFNQVTYDSIDPELEVEQLQSNGYVNTENTQINVDDANPFTTQVFDENGEVLNTREAKQAADGTYYDRFGIGWLGEGKFTVKVTDKAGNITEETFTVDHTPASMVYSTVDFDGTGIDYVEENKQKIFYIKNDTSFVFRMQFSEELAENPILTINGTKKTELELVEKFVTNEGKYIYQGTVNVTAEDKFEDGQLQLIVSNIKDLAGNETTDPLVTDQTVTSNSRTVVLDSKIDVVLFKTNSNNANSSSLAKAGDWIGIYLQVGEELKQDPTFMINGEVVTTSYLGEFNGVYAYQAGITVTKEMSGKIDFAISNIIDKANNNLTLSSEECEYSVTIDNDAPIIDLSAIPSKFEVGVDTYVYPQPGVVTDNVDGNISFGNVHMNWYHMNDDRTKGEATTCFGYNNWNTTLKGCSLGNYIITYRVSDTVGNETTAEKQITLQDTTKAVIEPDRKDGETFIQGVDEYNTETGTITDNYDDVNFSDVNIEYYLQNNDGSETHVAYFDKPSDLSNIQAGVYRIHYWYSDSSDNYSEVNRILYVKNMDVIEKVNELVQDAVRAMNDGNMAVKEQQHAIDLARQEANKLPNFVEKDAALETINNLQAAMDNNNKYREVYGYLLSAQEAYADNDLTNTQHYIDVVKQQISNIDGFETEVANIEKAINELQENVNNKKGFDNALALLETAQTSFNDGSLDETVQYNIDVARQSLSKFEGYATEKQNIINALDTLQTNFNNRKNYNRCLELLEIAKTSLNDGSTDEVVQYNIDVAYQSLENVTGYEAELANIKASLDKISSELHNR